MAVIRELRSNNADDSYYEGDIVMHSEFGKGRVEKVIGSGENLKVIVKFEVEGIKKLMVKYAKMEKLESKAPIQEPKEEIEEIKFKEPKAKKPADDEEEEDEEEFEDIDIEDEEEIVEEEEEEVEEYEEESNGGNNNYE